MVDDQGLSFENKNYPKDRTDTVYSNISINNDPNVNSFDYDKSLDLQPN